MSTLTTARRAQEIALEQIEVGGNVRELDPAHVTALAGSMAVRGLIVPVALRPLGAERFALVAGEHRLAAARELGWSSIAAVISEQAEGSSGDQGAENVLRKTLTPFGEARAVQKMLADGYTVDGAATVLGWHKRRVTARQRILELPETAQTLVGSGEIPVGAIDALLEIQAISPKLAALVADVVAEALAHGDALGEQLARDPGWLVRQALSHRPGELFAALAGGTLYEDQIAELKLGKKTTALYEEAKTLHGQLDRYAYGPLRVAQARAVLRVLGGCGLRVSELAGAQLADLVAARPSVADRAALQRRDVDGWSLHVRGKGGRRRTVSVIASARTAVLTLHRLADTPAPALVPALTVHRAARVADPPRSIAARTVQQLIGRLALVANELADGDVIPAALAHPHALRHGFALRYLSPPEPGTLSRLQQLLGHDDIATTARYLAAVDERRAPAPRDPWAR